MNCFTKNPYLLFFFFFGGGSGEVGECGEGGLDGWTDEQVQTNLPLQFLRSWKFGGGA